MTSKTEHPFIGQLLEARVITEVEAACLVDEVDNMLNEDPYGIEPYESIWTQRGVTPVYLVNAYHRSQRYGGPEEGGWWYTQYDALTKHYAEYHDRSFIVAGPFRSGDLDEAWDVAGDLNAIEGIGHRRESDVSIYWRVQSHVACDSRRPVYW